MVDPITCDAVLPGNMPQPTAAAAPLLEPPGVRARSCGLRVLPPRSVAANSVVTLFDRITAPALRNVSTQAASTPVPCPAYRALLWPVGMSRVAITSLTVTVTPASGPMGPASACARAIRGS